MKRVLFITIAFLSGCLVSAEQITTPKQVLACDGYATLDISLSNTRTDLVAFQMDLQLPEGVSIDKAGCSLSSRIIDIYQNLVIGRLESGVYRLASTSMSLNPFCGNDSTLLTLRLTTSDAFVYGDALISNILFSTSNSEGIEMDDVSFSMNTLYKFTYKVDGEEYKTSSIAYGTELTAETAPTKEGYAFSGWSEIPATMPAHDVEVTGTFTVNSYTVTFMYGDKVVATERVDYGAEIPLPELQEEWLDVPETMPAHDIIIYAALTDAVRTVQGSNLYAEYYQLNGIKRKNLQRGINILRMNDGTTRKVMLK